MIFDKPGYLFLLLIIIPIVIGYFWKSKSRSAKLQVSTLTPFVGIKKTYKYYLLHVPFFLKMVALAMIIIVLARPQSSNDWENKKGEGIDVMLSMDISTSMLAQDLKPNRLEAAKVVASNFIEQRQNDNIGLVVFSGAACTICPLTNDHECLNDLVSNIDTGMVRSSGTCIGLGLASAVNRLKDSKTKSKVIILMTDGSDTGGNIDPNTGADLAKSFGIRVYTIGVGTNGVAPMPIWDETTKQSLMVMVPVEIDESTLKSIAQKTNGKYFRATNNQDLENIYSTIDKLEKSKITISSFSRRKELFLPFGCISVLCLFLSLLLNSTILRHNP